MPRREIDDQVRLPVRVSADVVEGRWWSIVQPPPSVAFSLRSRIGAAMGPMVDVGMRQFLMVVDPQAEDDLIADAAAMGDAVALQTFRRVRAGQGIVTAAALVEGDRGLHAGDVAGVLLHVATYVARASGGRIDGPLLLGVHERNTPEAGDAFGFRWPGPSLLHRLLLDSRLKYLGCAERPRAPSGIAGEDHPGGPLFAAVNRGSVGGFIAALDDVVTGPDELTLLYVWALLHLWRPF